MNVQKIIPILFLLALINVSHADRVTLTWDENHWGDSLYYPLMTLYNNEIVCMRVIVTSIPGDGGTYSNDRYTINYFLTGRKFNAGDSGTTDVDIPLGSRDYVSTTRKVIQEPVCTKITNTVPRGSYRLEARLRKYGDDYVTSTTQTESFYVKNFPFTIKSVAIDKRVASPNEELTATVVVEKQIEYSTDIFSNVFADIKLYMAGLEGDAAAYTTTELYGPKKYVGKVQYTWLLSSNVYTIRYTLPGDMPTGKYKFFARMEGIFSGEIARQQTLSAYTEGGNVLNFYSRIPGVSIQGVPTTVKPGAAISPVITVTGDIGSCKVTVKVTAKGDPKPLTTGSTASATCNPSSASCVIRPSLSSIPASAQPGTYRVYVLVTDNANKKITDGKAFFDIEGDPTVVWLNINNKAVRPDNDPAAGPVPVGTIVPGSVVVKGACNNWNVVAQLTRQAGSEVLSTETLKCNEPYRKICVLRFTSLRIPAGSTPGDFKILIQVKDRSMNLIKSKKFFINAASNSVLSAGLTMSNKYSAPGNEPSVYSPVQVGTRIPGILTIKGDCSNWNVVAQVTPRGNPTVISSETLRCNSPNQGVCYLGFRSLMIPEGRNPGVYRIWVHVKDSSGKELESFRFFINGVSDEVQEPIGVNLYVNYNSLPANVEPRNGVSVQIGSLINGRIAVTGACSNWNVVAEVTRKGNPTVLSSESYACNSPSLKRCYLSFRNLRIPADKKPGVYRIWVHVKDSSGKELKNVRFFVNGI